MNVETINLPINKTYSIITCHTDAFKKNNKVYTIISYLNDDENKFIDEDKSIIKIIRENKTFKISKKDIIGWGKIDLSDDSNDIAYIKKAIIINCEAGRGETVPAKYDYNTHTAKTVDGIAKRFDTTDPILLLKYHHGLLGKPNKVIIFKSTLK